MTPAEWIGIAAGSTVFASAITAAATRRPSMIKAFTESYERLAKRLADVETKVDHLESALHDERKEHGVTKEGFRVALRYIREAVAWASGPRHTEFPPPPAELMREL